MNGQLYIVPELSNVFQQWVNQDQSFIASKIFPEVVAPNERFIAWSGGKESLIIPSSTLRFGRAKANEVSFSRSTTEYGPLSERALSNFITERQYNLSTAPLDVETQTVEGIASQMQLVDEKGLADTLADTTVITNYTTKSGTGQWSDYANSNPFADITTAVQQQALNSPMPANACWMDWLTWLQIINHPDFLLRLKLTEDKSMTPDQFLTLLAPYGITSLYVGKATYNSAKEGQTASMGRVWGKHFWIGYITETPGMQQINGGYKFRLENARRVSREQFNNPPGSELVNRDVYDYILLSAAVYYMIQNVIA